MSKRLSYERFVWFHCRIKENSYPNVRHLVDEFEIAERTARRDIEFMRNRLQAPLEYVRTRRGYRYSDDAFELPASWIDEHNVLSLALAVRLASTIPDRAIKDDLCRLMAKVVGMGGDSERHDCLQQLEDRISVKNIEYARVNEQFFHRTVLALLDNSPLHITYQSPYSGITAARTVQPLHLMHYMGSWHLLAWCKTRKAIRDFALSRLLAVEPAHERIVVPADLPPIKDYTRRHFGIMQGEATHEVTLSFTPEVAARVREQVWHDKQRTIQAEDGSLLLSFPAADFRELTKVILGYGAGVRVVGPADLRNLIRLEIEKMGKIYDYPDII